MPSITGKDWLPFLGIMLAAVAVWVVLNNFQNGSENYDVPTSMTTSSNFVPNVIPAVPALAATQTGFPSNPVSTIAPTASTYPVVGTTGSVGVVPNSQVMPTSATPGAPVQAMSPLPTPGTVPVGVDDNVYDKVSGWKGPAAECYPKDVLSADELLPSATTADAWAAANPAGQGDLKDKNFLSAGYLYGQNTVGSSLKNSSYDIRGDSCSNPQVAISPFLQSSIMPDLYRKKLNLGGGGQQC